MTPSERQRRRNQRKAKARKTRNGQPTRSARRSRADGIRVDFMAAWRLKLGVFPTMEEAAEGLRMARMNHTMTAKEKAELMAAAEAVSP